MTNKIYKDLKILYTNNVDRIFGCEGNQNEKIKKTKQERRNNGRYSKKFRQMLWSNFFQKGTRRICGIYQAQKGKQDKYRKS